MSRCPLFLLLFLYLIPLCTSSLLGQTTDIIIPPPPPVEEWGFVQIAEYMPLLRQCIDQYTTYAEQQQCTEETIMSLVHKNLRWPASGFCSEGTAIVSFIVEKDGQLSEFQVRRAPGPPAAKEALRVVKLMAETTTPWLPSVSSINVIGS